MTNNLSTSFSLASHALGTAAALGYELSRYVHKDIGFQSADSTQASSAAAPLGPQGQYGGRTAPSRSSNRRVVGPPDTNPYPAPPTLSGGSKRQSGDGTLSIVQAQHRANADAPSSASHYSKPAMMSQPSIPNERPSIFEDMAISSAIPAMDGDTMNTVIDLSWGLECQGVPTPVRDVDPDLVSKESLEIFFSSIEGPGLLSTYAPSLGDSKEFSILSCLGTPSSLEEDLNQGPNPYDKNEEVWIPVSDDPMPWIPVRFGKQNHFLNFCQFFPLFLKVFLKVFLDKNFLTLVDKLLYRFFRNMGIFPEMFCFIHNPSRCFLREFRTVIMSKGQPMIPFFMWRLSQTTSLYLITY
jgi:hypothetical protein